MNWQPTFQHFSPLDEAMSGIHLFRHWAGFDWLTPHACALQVHELQKRTNCLPDDYFVVLVGDMITEEALPTYMAMLNTLDGVRDETGAADTPWGRWNRAWTAEENRHGDLMNKYCYLSGRVNMKVGRIMRCGSIAKVLAECKQVL